MKVGALYPDAPLAGCTKSEQPGAYYSRKPGGPGSDCFYVCWHCGTYHDMIKQQSPIKQNKPVEKPAVLYATY